MLLFVRLSGLLSSACSYPKQIALSFVFILLWIGECISLSWRLTYVHWT
jgi:hypothetical protein